MFRNQQATRCEEEVAQVNLTRLLTLVDNIQDKNPNIGKVGLITLSLWSPLSLK